MKTANKPMLVHQRWKAKQAELAAANAKEGKSLGDGRAYTPSKYASAYRVVCKSVVLALLLSVFLSRAITNTWAWGYTPKYNSVHKVSHSLPGSVTAPN